MTSKLEVVQALDQEALVLPEMISAALAANDRVKYLLALVQSACARADSPEQAHDPLDRERRLAGVDDASLDDVVGRTERTADGRYLLPQAGRIVADVFGYIETMLAPLRQATSATDVHTHAADAFATRLATLRQELEPGTSAGLTAATLHVITSIRRGERDSVHLLVMDVHRALNALQVDLSSEDVGGAAVYGITDWDRPRIAAFMAGLSSTAPLKFDHPGLGTVASRSGETLVIQNEIGTTDAHVLVLHVDGLAVTVHYTDVHPRRLAFFQRMFGDYRVEWQETHARRVENLNDGESFFMCTGRLAAADLAGLDAYLRFLGSRIVFLIDWNRARKRLQSMVKRRAAIGILEWAAAENLGHRGFLELGGEAFVQDVVATVATGLIRPGMRLCDLIGDDSAAEFLRVVLRSASEGLRERRSQALIRDEVRVDLMTRLTTEKGRTFQLLLDHAWMISDMAGLVETGLAQIGLDPEGADVERIARRLKRWESDADGLIRQLRSLEAAHQSTDSLRRLGTVVDDAADALEEAAFALSLLDRRPGSGAVALGLRPLGALVSQGAHEFVKVLDAGRSVAGGGRRRDVQDFLAAIDRVVAIEREADQAERDVLATLVRECDDVKALYLASRVAGGLESATDALRHAAESLHDQILNQMMR